MRVTRTSALGRPPGRRPPGKRAIALLAAVGAALLGVLAASSGRAAVGVGVAAAAVPVLLTLLQAWRGDVD
jgi:hypothetical protein